VVDQQHLGEVDLLGRDVLSHAHDDIAVVAQPGTYMRVLRDVGATWVMHAFWPGHPT
jgi:hypothetical protein